MVEEKGPGLIVRWKLIDENIICTLNDRHGDTIHPAIPDPPFDLGSAK
jgi:hypothetical protein